MEINISSHTRITEIQNQFSKVFPNLRLAFFHDKNHDGHLEPAERVILPHTTIGDIRSSGEEGVLKISEHMKVRDLENLFSDQYDLTAQVLRRSGNLWLVTTRTDKYSLTALNELSNEMDADAPGETLEYEDGMERE